MKMPPKERTIIVPEGGWKENTWYLVEVSYRTSNPIHKSLFYTGFLNGESKGHKNTPWPGGYNGLVPENGPDFEDSPNKLGHAHFLKVVRQIHPLNFDYLESQEFYEVMQAYRTAPISDQKEVVIAFETVKAFIRGIHARR